MKRPARTPIERLPNFYEASTLPVPTHQTEFYLRGLARPTGCAAQWKRPLLQETHQETWGRQLQSGVEAIASSCFAQILAE